MFKKAIVFTSIVAAFAAPTSASATIVSSESVSTVNSVEVVKSSTKVKVTYVAYVAVSRSRVAKKKGGKMVCYWAKGTWTNTGRNASGAVRRYRETSKAKFCRLKKPVRVGGVTYRHVKVAGGRTGSPCYNYAVPPRQRQPRPQLRGKVVDVKRLDFKVKITLKSTARAAANAYCVSYDAAGRTVSQASAYAEATGEAAADEEVKVSAKTKTSARLSAGVSLQQKTAIEIDAQLRAEQNLVARASANCAPGQQAIVCPVGSEFNGERCAKDGTTTPQPPAEAPGTNPAPSPDEPFPGGHKCYSETTGSPVDPLADGRCPVGSFGE